MRAHALVGLAILAVAEVGCSDSAETPDAAPEVPDLTPWLARFPGTTTLTFDVPAGSPIPQQIVSTTYVGTESLASDYDVSLERDDDLDRWSVPLVVDGSQGDVVPGYSFGSFIADDPDGNTTVIMMVATGGTAMVGDGLALTVEGTIRAQQGVEVADGTFLGNFAD